MSQQFFSSLAVRLAFTLCLGLLAAPVTAGVSDGWELEVVTGGFSDPVAVRHAGDGSDRLFVVERAGRIRIWDGEQILATPFLDIVSLVNSGLNERGLLGLTFHPDYDTNGLFYVYYTRGDGDTVVAQFDVSANPDVADAGSRFELLIVGQPDWNHNGGDIHFGPDGMLYIGLGDGGSAGDPQCFAQTPSELLGKMLRIEVDPDGTSGYSIPPDNPFGDEVWSLGLRNPWRWSFDRETGDMFIGDVGQSSREEISFEEAGSMGGVNFGWKVMEGTFCHDPDPIDPDCPAMTPSCGDPAYTPPIMEVSHGAGDCAIIGGYRYRGTFGPAYGQYFFSDSCSDRVWVGTEDAPGVWSYETFPGDSTPCGGCSPSSFGEDEQGELYMVGRGNGTLYKFFASSIFGDGFESGDTSSWGATVP